MSDILIGFLSSLNVFFVPAGGSHLFTFPETLELERRCPFLSTCGSPCATLFLHGRTTTHLTCGFRVRRYSFHARPHNCVKRHPERHLQLAERVLRRSWPISFIMALVSWVVMQS